MTVAGVAGIIVLVLAWAGPLPGLVQSSFAAHMALHMLVTGVAAPLLAAGLAPLVVRRGGVAIPVMASLLDFAVIWGWHAPALHEAARTGATVLAVGALRIGKGAWDALMDRRADPAIIAGIAEIARGWPGVRGFHNLKTRTAGSRKRPVSLLCRG